MIENRTKTGLAALGLALALASCPRPAVASESPLALLTVLLRATVDQPALELSPAERAELEQLKPDTLQIRRMLDGDRLAHVLLSGSRRSYRPMLDQAASGYQTVQSTVDAAVDYWTGNQQQAQQAPASHGDPYGFTAWLNGVRAQSGLGPVVHDDSLAAWANMNNAQQNAMGLGHHVMGPARRQNSAMGNAASIGGQWLASPAHAAALLDPTIRVIGIAGMGAFWTFNAY